MTVKKLKLIPGSLYYSGRAAAWNLTDTTDVVVSIPENSVIMFVSIPEQQPKDICNCVACRKLTVDHFLFEDKIVMIWNAKEHIPPNFP